MSLLLFSASMCTLLLLMLCLHVVGISFKQDCTSMIYMHACVWRCCDYFFDYLLQTVTCFSSLDCYTLLTISCIPHFSFLFACLCLFLCTQACKCGWVNMLQTISWCNSLAFHHWTLIVITINCILTIFFFCVSACNYNTKGK